MNIAVVLTHNKSDADNVSQIKTLLSLMTIHEIDDGDQITHYYTFNDLVVDHQVSVYQILPFGVSEPANFYSLDSHNVLFRKGDEDKVGDHPRFFNWGLKRATDDGADLVVKIDDISTFSPKELMSDDSSTLTTLPWGVTADRAVQELHDSRTTVLDETLPIASALDDLAVTVAEVSLEATIG